jgi:M6 family metalloprotease-like protein
MVAVAMVLAAGLALATIAPKDGGPLPQQYRDRLATDKTAYQMQRAWIHKVRAIKQGRDAYIKRRLETDGPQALAAPLPQQFVVSGTVETPVFVGYFQSQSSPYAASNLQDKLFDNPSGTVTDYYDEVSYGNLNMTGTVYGWTQVSNLDTYYAGTSNGLNPANARVGEFIKELLDANDASLDFGQFDNDGPDGVPNSGDDDGYVDVAAFVHNEIGGECTGNNNIWSHRWVYRAWNISGNQPYTTNDPAAGGGFIRVDDYTIMPAKNCNGTVIDIGVFCHEFGHAFGLPDLYDTNGNGNGIGWWGIMGSGNWNTPASPAHPCAWTREVLGWVIPTVVDWTNGSYNIPDIENNAVAFKLPFSDDRWRRSGACPVDGSYSLYCGLSQSEETVRAYLAAGPGGGYGSNWIETVEREFTYSGSGSVNFQYSYGHNLEQDYDFAYAIVEVNGSEYPLELYTGVGSGSENFSLNTFLAPLSGVGGSYTLKFRVITDFSFDDEDGNYNSSCGAMAVDNISVTGGGESYSTDFETWVDGWHQDPVENPATEYWLVENRRAGGFDANLVQDGLLVMHVDQGVMWSNLGNSGGSGASVRGVVVEEANGDFDLNGTGSNRGETTDAFPGTANVTSFTSATNPGSNDNTGRPTRIQITGISAAAATMSATMRAGDPAPQTSSVAPSSVDNDETALALAVTGGLIRHGATVRLSKGGDDITADGVEWVDPTRVVGTFNFYGREPGSWDLVVTNPDGQTVVLPGAVTINGIIVATALQSASVEAVGGAVVLTYELLGQEPDETVRVYRSVGHAGDWRLVEDNLRGNDRGIYTYRDSDVEPGTTYHYLLTSFLAGEEHELHRGSAMVPAGELRLAQNVPNPFNPTTSIRFYLPQRSRVALQVYDITGALVRELASGAYDAGPHDIQWDGRDGSGTAVGSGVYFYRLITAGHTLTRKMVLLK